MKDEESAVEEKPEPQVHNDPPLSIVKIQNPPSSPKQHDPKVQQQVISFTAYSEIGSPNKMTNRHRLTTIKERRDLEGSVRESQEQQTDEKGWPTTESEEYPETPGENQVDEDYFPAIMVA